MEKTTNHPEIECLRPRELCKALGITAPTLYRWVKQGKLPRPIRIGGASLFRLAEVAAALEAAPKGGAR